jgi:3-dehydroquinate synthase
MGDNMNRMNVNTNSKQYDIVFNNSFDNLVDEILSLDIDISKIGIISDDHVSALYTDEVENLLTQEFKNVFSYVFKSGEENKNLSTISDFYRFLTDHKFDRKSLLIALGGGVTGDMVGFLGATYLRGIRFIQVPTTLLSQVDSSIGGKTGVDFNGHKNLVGAFYQPELVYINTATLKSLPREQFSSGMGEVIKHGLIQDKQYLTYMIDEKEKIHALDHETISQLIKRSCEIKSAVVKEDEKENGIRATLNFGHTVGHAIERLKDFELLHGECVAIGMVAAAYISKTLGHITDEDYQLIKAVITLYHLPISVSGLSEDEIYEQMFYDKKTSHDTLNFILLNKMGGCYINSKLDQPIIMNAIHEIIT